jgi:PAS domain S-box-containing protein
VTATKHQTATELRRRATEQLRGPSAGGSPSDVDANRIISELEIHQVELQLQNEELREARRELEIGLTRYKGLFDFAPIGYVILDDIGAIRAVNFAAASLLQRTRDELVGRAIETIIGTHPELIQAQSRAASFRVGDPTTASCELTVVRPDGRSIDVRVTIVVLADEVPNVLVAMEDITAQKRELERQVQEQERERLLASTRRELEATRQLHEIGMLFLPEGSPLDVIFAKIVEAAISIACAARADLQIFDPRSGASRIRAQRGFEPWWVGFWDRAASSGARGAAVRRGERVIVEDIERSPIQIGPEALAIKRKAGVRAVIATPLVSRSGKALGALSTYFAEPHRPDDSELRLLDLLSRQAADLIDRANAEEVETVLRRRFEALDLAAVLLSRYLTEHRDAPFSDELVRDLAEVARSVCRADCAAVGLRDGGSLRCVPSAGAPETAASARGRLEPIVALLESRGAERSVRHRDADALYLASAIRDGSLGGCLCVARNRALADFDDDDRVTLEMLADRIEIGVQAAQLARERVDAIRARENLLAVVSHDLRSPLSAIRLSASFLSRGGSGDRAQSAQQLDLILRSSERMARLIDDLLQAASIEAGRFSVEASRVDVRPMVHETMRTFEPAATEKSVQLSLDVPDGVRPVRADRQRIIQVLSNLIGNAIKFAASDGHVHIRARDDGDRVEIAVSDDGPGIPEDEVARIFERYERGKATGCHGVGLGLYIAKGIVEAHGGRMWLVTERGAGSTFYFTLPVDDGSHVETT